MTTSLETSGLARHSSQGCREWGRLWQAAGTVQSALQPGLMEQAADAGLRSLFVGFETLAQRNLKSYSKPQNLNRDYGAAIKRLHDLGIMVNASFVFGMDEDDPDVFERTVDWAVEQGIETSTFHILTPYPGTRLYERMKKEGRILHSNWNDYDTRHVVFKPKHLSVAELETGYWESYKKLLSMEFHFSVGAGTKETIKGKLRHVAYAAGLEKV